MSLKMVGTFNYYSLIFFSLLSQSKVMLYHNILIGMNGWYCLLV